MFHVEQNGKREFFGEQERDIDETPVNIGRNGSKEKLKYFYICY